MSVSVINMIYILGVNDPNVMSCGLKAFWMLYAIAINTTIVVTIAYWTYLFAVPAAGTSFSMSRSCDQHLLYWFRSG